MGRPAPGVPGPDAPAATTTTTPTTPPPGPGPGPGTTVTTATATTATTATTVVVTTVPSSTLWRNAGHGLDHADDLTLCVYEQNKNLIRRPCAPEVDDRGSLMLAGSRTRRLPCPTGNRPPRPRSATRSPSTTPTLTTPAPRSTVAELVADDLTDPDTPSDPRPHHRPPTGGDRRSTRSPRL